MLLLLLVVSANPTLRNPLQTYSVRSIILFLCFFLAYYNFIVIIIFIVKLHTFFTLFRIQVMCQKSYFYHSSFLVFVYTKLNSVWSFTLKLEIFAQIFSTRNNTQQQNILKWRLLSISWLQVVRSLTESANLICYCRPHIYQRHYILEGFTGWFYTLNVTSIKHMTDEEEIKIWKFLQ